MAVFSAAIVIRSLVVLNLVLAYFLLTSPSTISENNIVFILGAAMDVPQALSFSKPSAVSALLGATISFLGVTDLFASFSSDETFLSFWSTQAPIRTLFFFLLTLYSWLSSPKNTGMRAVSEETSYATEGLGESLGNSMVFAWGFYNSIIWFWLFSALRDERMEMMAKIHQKKEVAKDNNQM